MTATLQIGYAFLNNLSDKSQEWESSKSARGRRKPVQATL